MNIPSSIVALKTTDLSTYWPGFQKVAYALYDEESVYLYNHPNFPEEPYAHLPWSEAFVGNTLIVFHEIPTAIVRRADYPGDAELVAALVHELFHGYQHLLEESRFPDEVQGVLYPLEETNAALRSRERYHLYHSVLPTDPIARDRHLRQFVQCREERMAYLGESIRYELLTETVEGPAFYVESQAFLNESGLLKVEVLRQYGESLLDVEDGVRNLRKSCCDSGIFLCYVLDRIFPEWKEEYVKADVTLYSLVRRSVDVKKYTMEPLEASPELRDVLTHVKVERAAAFYEAQQAAPVKLKIQGDLRIVGIDPMNIVAGERRALHRHFIRAEIGESTYLFRYPVIGEYQTYLLQCHQLLVLLDEEPEASERGVLVKGVGELTGHYDAETHTLHVPDKHS
ncbi:hypothetical protein [Sporosarcina sp. A2]|uniref:hypothetical protein n=1 Tax=Sporosarcina sp. A2 TaxID=3393449 RepID=UPI003D7B6FBD